MQLPGTGELLVILLILIILFGATRIPKIGDALGRGIRNFSNSLRGKPSEDSDERESNAAQKKDPHDHSNPSGTSH